MVKNITLSAEETLIEKARARAAEENRSLNDAFREWIEKWAAHGDPGADYDALMVRLGGLEADRKFSREEMNAR